MDVLIPKTRVQRAFMIKSVELKSGKADFLYMEVFDKSVVVKTYIWERTVVARHRSHPFKPSDVLFTTWLVDTFNNDLQLKLPDVHDRPVDAYTIEQIERGELEGVSLDTFLRGSAISQQDWLQHYKTKVEPLIEDEPIKKLLDICLADPKFWGASAAKGMHQYWRGGLSEHVHRMLQIFLGINTSGHPSNKYIRRGIVIAGIILHDWAKAYEYQEVAPGQFDYSEWGGLMGHLAGGPILFARQIERYDLMSANDPLFLHLMHTLLAHHGQIDWGSPVAPCTAEATMLHHIDNLDGHLSMIEETPDGVYHKGIRGKVYHIPQE